MAEVEGREPKKHSLLRSLPHRWGGKKGRGATVRSDVVAVAVAVGRKTSRKPPLHSPCVNFF